MHSDPGIGVDAINERKSGKGWLTEAYRPEIAILPAMTVTGILKAASHMTLTLSLQNAPLPLCVAFITFRIGQ